VEEPRDPLQLADEAERLLEQVHDDPWLAAHVRALWVHARKLTGERFSYAEEGELAYGFEPRWHDEDAFRRAGTMLEEALPGEGELRTRLASWYESVAVPADILEQAIRDIAAELRRLARGTIGLPHGEGFELELVRDKRWLGYAKYLGGLRTKISVNTDLPFVAADLVNVTSHEIYGGHHTHHVWQEVELVRGRNQIEWTIALLWSPSAVISEGIATTGPTSSRVTGRSSRPRCSGGWASTTTPRLGRASRKRAICCGRCRRTSPCCFTTAAPRGRRRGSTRRSGRSSRAIGSTSWSNRRS